MVTRSCFSSRLQTSLFEPSLYLNQRPHDREASTLPLCYLLNHSTSAAQSHDWSDVNLAPFLTDIKKGSYHQLQSSCLTPGTCFSRQTRPRRYDRYCRTPGSETRCAGLCRMLKRDDGGGAMKTTH